LVNNDFLADASQQIMNVSGLIELICKIQPTGSPMAAFTPAATHQIVPDR